MVLLKNNYPDWVIKESEKKPATLIINSNTGLEVKKTCLHLCYVLGFSDDLEETVYRSSLKKPRPLNPSFVTLKIKLHQK